MSGEGEQVDAVNVDTGTSSDYHLSLDQGMILAAIGNALADDMLRRDFVTPEFERDIKLVIGVEKFNASPNNQQ